MYMRMIRTLCSRYVCTWYQPAEIYTYVRYVPPVDAHVWRQLHLSAVARCSDSYCIFRSCNTSDLLCQTLASRQRFEMRRQTRGSLTWVYLPESTWTPPVKHTADYLALRAYIQKRPRLAERPKSNRKNKTQTGIGQCCIWALYRDTLFVGGFKMNSIHAANYKWCQS